MKTLTFLFFALVMMLISGACSKPTPKGEEWSELEKRAAKTLVNAKPLEEQADSDPGATALMVAGACENPDEASKWIHPSGAAQQVCGRINKKTAGYQLLLRGEVKPFGSEEKVAFVKISYQNGKHGTVHIYLKEVAGKWRVVR